MIFYTNTKNTETTNTWFPRVLLLHHPPSENSEISWTTVHWSASKFPLSPSTPPTIQTAKELAGPTTAVRVTAPSHPKSSWLSSLASGWPSSNSACAPYWNFIFLEKEVLSSNKSWLWSWRQHFDGDGITKNYKLFIGHSGDLKSFSGFIDGAGFLRPIRDIGHKLMKFLQSSF